MKTLTLAINDILKLECTSNIITVITKDNVYPNVLKIDWDHRNGVALLTFKQEVYGEVCV